jgi:major vault protein
METRKGDVILPQGTYSLVQDGSTGNVETIVGPHKVSLADTDKPVVYDSLTRRYTIIPDAIDAIQTFPTASEGQYLVLINPVKENPGKHPTKGKQQTPELNVGNKINIPGPETFALFPGQVAEVLDGHQLKSNEYLIIRVYNEAAAKENLKHAIAKAADDTAKKGVVNIKESDIIIGKLFVIKGTDFSFYIPPTGIEVLKNDDGNFVQNAVTLERLEYCILLDQNGAKRYVQGPSVVFPAPTEKFVSRKNNKIFKAIELNEIMGIYIKVIADYEEGGVKRIAGEELFITGKEQKIYYPREEHSVIKYGDQVVHYAVALPEGEARYVLDKVTGKITMVKGPKMYLPDPRKEVVVNRILDSKALSLWYPGNLEAVERNQRFEKEMQAQVSQSESLLDADMEYSAYRGSMNSLLRSGKSEHLVGMKSRLGASDLAEEGMERKTLYTKPRSITLDTKYDGVVTMNIWPGYAIQTVKKDGKRDVVIGPKTVMLEYDETLEVLELSTGKPKQDTKLLKTVYLQTKNNVVSDIVKVETKDAVNVNIHLSYRVNFLEESKEKWFDVADYVKLLTQHLRSVVRNAVKKINIEEFNVSATDIVRDIVLGKPGEKTGRPLKKFEENGMVVYDVEVLAVEIGDSIIAELLKGAQHKVVRQNLAIAEKAKELEVTEKIESYIQRTLGVKAKTYLVQHSKDLEALELQQKKESAQLAGQLGSQKVLDEINQSELERQKAKDRLKLDTKEREVLIDVDAATKKLEAIQPGLIEAMITSSGVALTETLAANLKAQNPGLSQLFGGGGFKEILDTIKGTPLEAKFVNLAEAYKKLGDSRNQK